MGANAVEGRAVPSLELTLGDSFEGVRGPTPPPGRVKILGTNARQARRLGNLQKH